MEVDHARKYRLTSFKHKKTTPTDQNSVTLVIDLSIPTLKPERILNFNFRYVEGQLCFLHVTQNNKQLSEVFSTMDTFQKQVKMWEKRMNSCMYMSFPKIRQRKRKFKEN